MATVRHYFRDTQTEPGTGTVGAADVYDMSTDQGTPSSSVPVSADISNFTEVARFQLVVDNKIDGDQFPVSMDVASMDADTVLRWRVQQIGSGLTVKASSAYSAEYTTPGIKSDTLTLATTWVAGDILAVSIELNRSGMPGVRAASIGVQDTSSYVDPNFGLLAPTLTDPTGGIHNADGLTPEPFTWTYNTNFGDTQTDIAFRRDFIGPWAVAEDTPVLDAYAKNVAFSPDGTLLAIGHNSTPYLTIINTSDWSIVGNGPVLGGQCLELDFSPDGSLLAVSHGGTPYVTVYNTSDWSAVSGTPIDTPFGSGVDFNPAGTLLALSQAPSTSLTILNTSDWSVANTSSIVGNGEGVAFSPDGTLLATISNIDPYFRVFNTSNWSAVSGTPTLPGTGGGDVVFNPGGTLLVVVSTSSPYLTVLNTSDWSVVSGTPTLAGSGRGADFSPDGTLLAVAHSGSPNFTLINTSDWSVVSGTPILPGQGYDADFNFDASLLAAGHFNAPFLTIIEEEGWVPEWWNGSAWVSTETTIAHTSGTITFATGDWG